MRSVGFAVLAVAWSIVLPARSPAQTGPTVGLGFGLVRAWEETTTAQSVVSRVGVVREGEAQLAVSVVALDVVYRQGTLNPPDGGEGRELVEGQAMLGVRFVRWVTLEAGPRVRAYVTPAGTERWVLWEGHIEAAARVIRPNAWAYLWVERVLGADIPGSTALDEGQGAEAGLTARLGSAPLWGRLAYWIHQASTGGAQRVETIQGVSARLTVGIP